MNDRENEIYKQGAEEVKNTYAFIYDEEFSCKDMADMFLKGAIYADQHPMKGLWDAEKVIDWLNNWFTDDICKCDLPITKDARNTFFNDLRKAMED